MAPILIQSEDMERKLEVMFVSLISAGAPSFLTT